MKFLWQRQVPVGRYSRLSMRLSFTNWTFGIWWGDMGYARQKKRCYGIDLGPFELTLETRQHVQH